jgi:PPK2 family polyphosphate:nucleotide phosphotransferase
MQHNDFTVAAGAQVRLTDFNPKDTGMFSAEQDARQRIDEARERLVRAQDVLFANQSWTLLVVFQAMDAAGKDETIEGPLAHMSPQGTSVTMFKEPGGKELRHDYLWRFVAALPQRGQVGLFNRSYYEEVLSCRMHADKLVEQHLPAAIREAPDLWEQRFRQINNFEQYLVENGILVLKFFLHMSKDKQRERLLERITSEDKRWQFSWNDIEDHQQWDRYMAAYEDVLSHTSTNWAPWHIIPSDHRWYSGLVVTEAIAQTIESLDLRYPQGSEEDQEARAQAQALLEAEQRAADR